MLTFLVKLLMWMVGSLVLACLLGYAVLFIISFHLTRFSPDFSGKNTFREESK